MGKIAESGVGYCGGSSGSSMSVNGQIVSTENPPISYVETDGFIIVSDSTGQIAKLTPNGTKTLISSVAAVENTNYCGTAIGELVWSNGKKETNNTPISYELQQQNTRIQLQNNSSNPLSNGSYCFEFARADMTFVSFGIANIGDTVYLGFRGGSCGEASSHIVQFNDPSLNGLTMTFSSSSGNVTLIVGGNLDTESDISGLTVTAIQNKLVISDSTGQIAEYFYEDLPTGFVANCYEFSPDPAIVSVACKGECPSDTEYQCQCGNSLFCYGYDDSMTSFSVKYSTTID